MIKYQPLKTPWAIDENSSLSVVDQIQDRVNSESWYTFCKGYDNIKTGDISGKLGKPIEEKYA